MTTRDLLIEIGTEELPPKALANLSAALELSLTEQLRALQLSFGNVQRFASPATRGAVEALNEAQQDRENPIGTSRPARRSMTGGTNASSAGFAKSRGVEVDQLSRTERWRGKLSFW